VAKSSSGAKNAQVPPLVEAKRGGGGGEGSGVDSSPRSTVASIGPALALLWWSSIEDPPPPLVLAARLLEIAIQKPWSAAPAV
jgi:hypothetical protein